MSLDTKEANMAAPENRGLTGRHWVLIAAAAVLVVILLVRSVVDPTDWRSDIVAVAAIVIAVTSMLNLKREKTG
jgi:uncharacterized membrane protein